MRWAVFSFLLKGFFEILPYDSLIFLGMLINELVSDRLNTSCFILLTSATQ